VSGTSPAGRSSPNADGSPEGSAEAAVVDATDGGGESVADGGVAAGVPDGLAASDP
jgi:hypothetical protein